MNAAPGHSLTEQRKSAILAAYARLLADPIAWKDYQNELSEWDGLAGDGLGGPEQG